MLTAAYRIVLGLVFYLPLEDFLLKWLPVSDFVYLALRQAPDLLVLVAVGLVVAARVAEGGRIRIVGHGADAMLLLFVLIAAASTSLNEASPLAALLNLKALLRYVLVVYVLVNVPIGERRLQRVIGVAVAAVAIQAAVAGLQAGFGQEVVSFFLPPSTDVTVGGLHLEFAATWEAGRGRVFGTMGQTVAFAGFMVVGLSVWLATRHEHPLRYWIGILVFVALLYLSGSRASLITGIGLVFGYEAIRGNVGLKTTLGVLGAGVVAGIVALTSVNLGQTELGEIFTERYLDVAMNQRLGVVLLVIPEFVSRLDLHQVLLGMSGDPVILADFLADMFRAPRALLREATLLEDVYWGALMAYYGVVGFGCIAYFLVTAIRRVMRIRSDGSLSESAGQMATVALLLLLASVPLNLVGKSLEVRQFAFYMWTSVGLALAAWDQRPGAEARR